MGFFLTGHGNIASVSLASFATEPRVYPDGGMLIYLNHNWKVRMADIFFLTDKAFLQNANPHKILNRKYKTLQSFH